MTGFSVSYHQRGVLIAPEYGSGLPVRVDIIVLEGARFRIKEDLEAIEADRPRRWDMSHLTSRELEAIYRKARRIARCQRLSAEAPPSAPSGVFTPGVGSARGGVRIASSPGSSGSGRILLLCAAVLALAALTFGSETPWLPSAIGPSAAVMAETSTGAVDSLVWAEMVWAERIGDTERLTELSEAGSIFTVPSGTPVRIVGVGLNSRKVSPVRGEHAGSAAWVPLRAVLGP